MKSFYSSKKLIIVSLVLILSLLIYVFLKPINASLKNKQRSDSLYHLETLTNTIAQNIKGNFVSKWQNPRFFSTYFDNYKEEDFTNLWLFLAETKANFKFRSIYVFTEDFVAYDETGTASAIPFPNDYLKVIKGTQFMYWLQGDTLFHLYYTPSHLRINDKKIFAIALGYNLTDFFENFNFTPFEDESTIYILSNDGKILGYYNSDGLGFGDNIINSLQNANVKNYSDEKLAIGDYLKQKKTFTGTVTFEGSETENYVIILPSANETMKGSSHWCIYYSVPTKTVNYNSSQYSIFLTTLTSIILVVFIILVIIVFALAYNHKSRKIVEKMESNEDSQNQLLKMALAMAEQSNQAKSAFLSNMSHDIRTPLNAIISMSNFALNDVTNTTNVKNYLTIIKRSSTFLLQLVNNVLDMSRIESGKLVLKNELFNFESVYTDVLSVIKPQCEKKDIKLVSKFSCKTKKLLIGDNLVTKRILLNLLSNATKFTDAKGQIDFTIEEQKSINETIAAFKITVKDTGCGIDENMIDKIFLPFLRENDTKISNIEGTGLGLAITKSLIEAMGGSISVASKKHEGSTFTAELFFQISDSDNEKPEDSPETIEYNFNSKKVLVVEDNDINRQVISVLLKKMNLTFEFAEDGKIAVEKFEKSSQNAFDLIFMDIQMPNMNGYEATKLIREASHPQSKKIPIIAMTANVFDEDIEKCRKAGMNAHVGKPLDPDQLGKICNTFLGDLEI